MTIRLGNVNAWHSLVLICEEIADAAALYASSVGNLVAVGEAGSIALASERVNISSPSISAAIAQLEAEFGLALFVFTGVPTSEHDHDSAWL